jgi:tetratricopeptide (TPR) repeat protein
MGNLLLKDLQREIDVGNVIAVIGAGVSIAATNNKPAASWRGLLHHGVGHCRELKSLTGVDDKWAERVHDEINSGDLDDMLSAAEKIARRLGAPKGGEYSRWLRETIGELKAERRNVLEALCNLNVALATTNYDGLIEEVTELPAVTWMDGAKVERVLRSDERGILHLHGYWDRPESVILGIRSYENVLGDAHAQAMQRAMRALKTLLFVGCGKGLSDPNFGALLEWSAKVFAGAEYRHFRLSSESEVAELQGQHPPEHRIFVLSYGKDFDDLAPFLRGLRPAPARGHRPKAIFPAHGQAALIPPAPLCFGRESEIEDLVATLLADTPVPTPLLGPPGIGKSALTLVALNDPRLANRFGKRRFFIRCDSATSREMLVAEIARNAGLEIGPNVESDLFATLESEPVALALDNAETPWEADTLRVEEFLAQLAAVPGLALIASLRGASRPGGVKWRQAIEPRRLPLPEARKAFLAIAGEKFTSDPHLDALLDALDGVPLAITLLAFASEGEPDLNGVSIRWQRERIDILRRAEADHRLLNIEVSYEISIKGPRMTAEALRLLSLLGCLPDGVSHGDLEAVCPGCGHRAAAVLRHVGLAFDEASRLRVLLPLRECVRRKHPPQLDDLRPISDYYLRLAISYGKKAGGEAGAEAIARLMPETANMEAMILRALDEPQSELAISAALSLAKFISFTGLGSTLPLEKVFTIAQKKDSRQLLAANCIFSLGDIALARADHNTARRYFEQALPLYKSVESILGQANCIMSLGDIALERSDHDTARQHFEEALPLYKGLDDILGQANCIKGLGDTALAGSDHDTARQRFEQALKLFKGVGDILGQANCIKGLGDIALAGSDHDTARQHFEEALTLFKDAGYILGQANCIKGLGDIALTGSDHDTARQRFEQALKLFKGVGDILGQANCIKGLGDIALAGSDHDTGRQRYGEALTLYEQISEPYSVGWTHRYLARLARNNEERRQHVAAVRTAWQSNGRDDLVRDLINEFGQP